MNREEEFNLFKEWLIPQLEYKKGAFYTQNFEVNKFDYKSVELLLGIRFHPSKLNEYHKLLDKQINK